MERSRLCAILYLPSSIFAFPWRLGAIFSWDERRIRAGAAAHLRSGPPWGFTVDFYSVSVLTFQPCWGIYYGSALAKAEA
jgi:hypothetical protein